LCRVFVKVGYAIAGVVSFNCETGRNREWKTSRPPAMWFMTQERFATKEFFIYGQKRWMYRAPKTASPLNHSKRFMFQFQVIIVPRSLLKKAGTSHI
jgi:hypothetical protein